MLYRGIKGTLNDSPLNTRNYDDQGEPKITVTTIMTIGILIFYYCNQGDSILNEQVEFQEKRNLVKCYGEYSEVTKSFVVIIKLINSLKSIPVMNILSCLNMILLRP